MSIGWILNEERLVFWARSTAGITLRILFIAVIFFCSFKPELLQVSI